MPHSKAKLLDVRTSPIAERIAATDDFVAAGYEVIFLTHHPGLHEVNLRWHPEAEELLWTP